MKTSEDHKDIENIEAWAEVIKEALWLVPMERRADVLALVTKNEEAERREQEVASGLKFIDLTDDSWMNSPGHRHWNAIMRLKSLVVQRPQDHEQP